MKNRTIVPLGVSILAFVVILLAESIRIRTGERPLPIAWSASGIVLAAVVALRWWTVDRGDLKRPCRPPIRCLTCRCTRVVT